MNGEGDPEEENKMLEQIDQREKEKKLTKEESLKVRMEVDKERRMKNFKERQHSLNDRLCKQLRTLRSDFVFSKNKSANKLEKIFANKVAARLYAKEEEN